MVALRDGLRSSSIIGLIDQEITLDFSDPNRIFSRTHREQRCEQAKRRIRCEANQRFFPQFAQSATP
jgi:hypothetical protein